MALRIGEQVGEYVVVGQLGQGGMGSVFRVRNVISDREDALKVLVSDVASKPQIAERFLREIKVQASLSHPNIASLHTALRHENQLLMVMEFVDGETLDYKMSLGSVAGPHVLDWILQLLSALEYAHQRGVVHRDIKPANIIISKAGNLKLVDFGIAARDNGEFRLTGTGTPIGTLYYMSPEQIRTQAVDGRSDLYSTGIVLYEALAGRRPIDGDSTYSCMQAHLNLIPVPPHIVNPMIHPDLSRIIMRSLEKAPEQRFQSAGEFQAALRMFQRPQQTVPPVPVATRGITTSSPTPLPEGWDPAYIEQAKTHLAQFIGPMSRVLVKRALREATTVAQLYELLGREIQNEEDRKKFLALGPRR